MECHEVIKYYKILYLLYNNFLKTCESCNGTYEIDCLVCKDPLVLVNTT